MHQQEITGLGKSLLDQFKHGWTEDGQHRADVSTGTTQDTLFIPTLPGDDLQV